ncbi:MAG: hypothetical protein DID89_2727546964 [Candidatus Nitrotoga sp. CP45]|nr:MAG: hypothetical protein DID89_2727546964 [Candidatus Nitrotoga sp. CP45]
MHSPPSFNKLWKNFTGKSKKNPVNIVTERFLQAFKDHGVKPSQIPRLMPQIKLDHLQSEATLLAALTPELLDQTAKLFGISIKWLEGASEKIYEYQSCYKQPEIFFKLFCAIQGGKWIDDIGIPFRVLVSSKKLDGSSETYQPLVPVLVEKIAHLGDEPIYRYIVFNDGFDWSHTPARIQLKAMARIAYLHGGTVPPLLMVKPEILERILERKMIPHNYLQGGLVSDPSLEDFAMSADCPISKELAELPDVLKYIEEHNLNELFSKKSQQYREPITETQALPEVSPAITKPAQAGKRAQNSKDIWMPVRNTVQSWWAEEGDLLHIAQAIRRIKNMPHLKAAALSDSAIRKHIADLAPLNVRGKSGRKPN